MAVIDPKYTVINLATVRRNGQEVRTPVWFVERDGKLYVVTHATAGKIKRLRNNPKVRYVPCNTSGKTLYGDWREGTARLLTDEATAAEWIREYKRKYTWQYWLIVGVIYRITGQAQGARVAIEITPEG